MPTEVQFNGRYGDYARAIIAAVVAGLTALVAAADEGINPSEWVGIGLAFLVTGTAVWAIPSMAGPVKAWGKLLTAALISALGVLGTGLADGQLTQPEIIMAVVALLNGLVVSQVPQTKTVKDEPQRAAT